MEGGREGGGKGKGRIGAAGRRNQQPRGGRKRGEKKEEGGREGGREGGGKGSSAGGVV